MWVCWNPDTGKIEVETPGMVMARALAHDATRHDRNLREYVNEILQNSPQNTGSTS